MKGENDLEMKIEWGKPITLRTQWLQYGLAQTTAYPRAKRKEFSEISYAEDTAETTVQPNKTKFSGPNAKQEKTAWTLYLARKEKPGSWL